MADKAWKAMERRIARYFGVERNPLSGMNSRHSGSDTLHPRLFIDTKLRREFGGLWRTFKTLEGIAKTEGKFPVLVIKLPGQGISTEDSIVAVRLKDLKQVAEEVSWKSVGSSSS